MHISKQLPQTQQINQQHTHEEKYRERERNPQDYQQRGKNLIEHVDCIIDHSKMVKCS